MIRTFLRDILNMFGSLYYRIRATSFVLKLVNREGRKLYHENAATLSGSEEAVVAELRKCGIALVPMRELFDDAVFTKLQDYATRRWESPEVQEEANRHRHVLTGNVPKGGTKKAFLVNLWSLDAAQDKETDIAWPILDITHPFIRFSVSEPILRITNAYLGQLSKFRAWRLEATIPMPEGLRASSSQRWHRDEEDEKLVKVFLYLNDVDEGTGPFTYIKNSQAGGKWQHIFPKMPPRGTLPMPPDVDERVPQDDITKCIGKAGTIIFCDTTGLHKGGFAEAASRLMYTSVYTSGASLWPIRYRYPALFSVDGLTVTQRFAVENDPDQKEPKYYL